MYRITKIGYSGTVVRNPVRIELTTVMNLSDFVDFSLSEKVYTYVAQGSEHYSYNDLWDLLAYYSIDSAR